MERSRFRCPVKARARKGIALRFSKGAIRRSLDFGAKPVSLSSRSAGKKGHRVAVWQSGNAAEFGFWSEAGFVARSKRGQKKARIALRFSKGAIRRSLDFGAKPVSLSSRSAGKKGHRVAVWQSGNAAEFEFRGRSWFRCSVKARARKGESRVAVWQSGNPARLGFWGEVGFVSRSCCGQKSRWQATGFEVKRSRFQAKKRQTWCCNRRGARGEVGGQAKPVSFPKATERQNSPPKF